MLEKIRRQLRGLMRFIDKEEKGIVFTNFEDEMSVATEVVLSSVSASLAQYRKKVEHFIRSHEDQFVIKKLKNNRSITEADLITLEKLLFEASGMDSQDEYKKLFGSGKPLGQFVRELVGLDRVAAKETFADFLDEGKYNARQIEFINQLIDFLTANGVMESDALFESPFTDLHEEGVCGYYSEVDIEKLVTRIQAVNRNVMPDVRFGG